MNNNYLVLFILLLLSSLTYGQNAASKADKKLKELFNLMQGTYSSEVQSKKDTSYFNISLRMVPIWQERGYYLYVEQAMFENQEKPYRVRIYKLSHSAADEYVSEVYTFKNEKEWIGKWNNPASFDALNIEDIELKSGCEVIMKRSGKNKFIGETGQKTCKSELRGASYATSKVSVLRKKILSWDQGFDSEDKQVWGATKGGYIFDKL